MRKYGVAIVFAVMLALGLTTSFLYNKRPETLVGEALRQLADAKSFMAATTVGTFAPESIVKAAGADPALVLLPVVLVGEVAANLPNGQPMSGTATFVLVGGEKEGEEVTFDLAVTGDGLSYVKFANVPQEKASADVVDRLNQKWFSMRSRGLAALLAKDGDAAAADEDPTGKPSKDAWSRIRTAVTSGELFGPPVSIGAQVLGSTVTRRYALPFKPLAMERLAEDITIIVRGRSLSEEERAEIRASLADRDAALEVWIDKRTKRFVQLNLDVKAKGDGADADVRGKTSQLSVLVRITSWNEPVDVATPSESTPFADFISNLAKAKQ